MSVRQVTIHPSADVSPEASIGDGTRVWHEAQVREGARLGEDCIVGKGAYIDFGTGYDAQRGMIIDPGDAFQYGIPLLCAKITWVGLDVGTELHWQWTTGSGPLLPDDPNLNPTFNVDTRSGADASCLRATQGGQNVPIPMDTYGMRVYLGGNAFPSVEDECVVQNDPPPGKTAIVPATAIPTMSPPKCAPRAAFPTPRWSAIRRAP